MTHQDRTLLAVTPATLVSVFVRLCVYENSCVDMFVPAFVFVRAYAVCLFGCIVSNLVFRFIFLRRDWSEDL